MKKQLAQWSVCIIISATVAPTAGATGTDFYLKIMPLECSMDTVSLGYTTTTQLTPDSCLHPAAQSTLTQIPAVRAFSLPHTVPSVQPVAHTKTNSNDDKSDQGAAAGSNNGSEVPLSPSLSPIIAAVAITLIGLTYAGVLPHMTHRLRVVKIRLPWFK